MTTPSLLHCPYTPLFRSLSFLSARRRSGGTVVVGRACAIATVLTPKLDSTGAASHAKLPTVYKYTRVVTTADRKSTRLNSSHTVISYAVFCLKKKNKVNE